MGEVIVWTSADLNHQMAASTVIGDVSICLFDKRHRRCAVTVTLV